jgi:hypothetical protein
MATQTLQLPTASSIPFGVFEPFSGIVTLYCGPNDSSIQRGDRTDTGDNEARPDETGSGPAQPTADPTSFGGASSIRRPSGGRFDVEQERQDSDGIEVVEPTDGRLGLTNIGNEPPDDPIADAGETRTAESEP